MAKNTVILKNYLNIFEEYTAAAAITPGMLIELTSAAKVQAHSSAGANAIPCFALEDSLQGNGLEDAYASGDKVQCWIPQRGDIVYAILADGEDVSIGDYVESNGAGYLQKYVADTVDSSAATATVYPLQIVGQVLEALDLSDSSGAEESSATIGLNKRIQIRIS